MRLEYPSSSNESVSVIVRGIGLGKPRWSHVCIRSHYYFDQPCYWVFLHTVYSYSLIYQYVQCAYARISKAMLQTQIFQSDTWEWSVLMWVMDFCTIIETHGSFLVLGYSRCTLSCLFFYGVIQNVYFFIAISFLILSNDFEFGINFSSQNTPNLIDEFRWKWFLSDLIDFFKS